MKILSIVLFENQITSRNGMLIIEDNDEKKNLYDQ